MLCPGSGSSREAAIPCQMACLLTYCLHLGLVEQVHGLVKKVGMDSFSTGGNALLNSYCNCGAPYVAEKLFDELMFRDVMNMSL